MSSKSSFTTKELSRETWQDFVDLFSRGGGWDHCFCMHFHRPRSLPKEQRLPTRAERAVRNCKQKRALVDGGHAHGILVYVGEKPVGWCQYGRHEELPRVDNNRKYRALRLDKRISPAAKAGRRRAVVEPRLWRITCFVVDKRHRRQGIATAALKAALDSIRKQGGGIVEAYPISRWETRAFGNESTSGTLPMFKRQRFKVVAPLGATRFSSHVFVRRVL